MYTPMPIQRVHVGTSKKYCLIQMRSVEEATMVMATLNRTVLSIQNCVGEFWMLLWGRIQQFCSFCAVRSYKYV